jgi:transcriptional regulator with XRE-family HTH domain
MSDKSYTSTRPGAVAGNIDKLRNEAGWTRHELAQQAGLTRGTMDKFELIYEPPTNHPYLPLIVSALSKALKRDVTNEIKKGGSEYDFDSRQLARIYGSRPDLAPKGYFKVPPKPWRSGNQHGTAAPKRKERVDSKYDQLVHFLNTDKNIATLAKQFNMNLPFAKVNHHGNELGQGPRAIRERVYRLVRKLQSEGIKVRELAQQQGKANNVTPSNNHSSNGQGRGPGRTIREVVYTAVNTFNSRRMQGERTMVMPMESFEVFFSEYLKQSGISPNVLIGADIAKLLPK